MTDKPTAVRKQLIIPAEMDEQFTSIAQASGTTTSEIVRQEGKIEWSPQEAPAEVLTGSLRFLTGRASVSAR